MSSSIKVSYGGGFPNQSPSISQFMTDIGFKASTQAEAKIVTIHLCTMPSQIAEIKGYLEDSSFDMVRTSEHGLTIYYAVVPPVEEELKTDDEEYGPTISDDIEPAEKEPNPDAIVYKTVMITSEDEAFYGDGFFFIPFSNIAAISTRSE